MRAVVTTVAALLTALAAASGAQPAAAQSSFLGRTSEQWHARLLSQHAEERAAAAWAIAQFVERNPQLNESIRHEMLDNLLFHPDAAVRFWSIHGLQRLALGKETSNATREAVQTSLGKMLTDKAPAPRIAAAETLGLLGDPDRALPVLIAALSDPQDAVRIQAVTALEKLGEAARPAETTLRAATSDPSEYVKRISMRALQKLDKK